MRLVQLLAVNGERKIASVKGEFLYLIDGFNSVFGLVNQALLAGTSISTVINDHLSASKLNYQEVWEGKTDWQWLPSMDHPLDVNKCMVTGTGLTHKASAVNRDKMNEAANTGLQTDSMKVYFWGEEGGKPKQGEIGVQPEWFYKGNGSVLRGHLANLDIPEYANDGGEEPEIAGVYLIDFEGNPVRIGFTIGNEFSDHVMERKNYLYLAPSKIRTCSVGPELVLDADFKDISGSVSIERSGEILWQKDVKTGEANMAHSLENLEYHHFKYANHRIPGQVHVHFFGTGAFSFGDGIKLIHDDSMKVDWSGMGKALINKIAVSTHAEKQIQVKNLSL